MKKRLVLPLLSILLLLFTINVSAHHEPATNKDGSIVTNVLSASFDPQGLFGLQAYPIPTNFFY